MSHIVTLTSDVPYHCSYPSLLQSDAFTKEDIAKLASKLSGRKACIGVKKLLGLIDMVKQTDPRYFGIFIMLWVCNKSVWDWVECKSNYCSFENPNRLEYKIDTNSIIQKDVYITWRITWRCLHFVIFRSRVNKLLSKLEEENFIELVA